MLPWRSTWSSLFLASAVAAAGSLVITSPLQAQSAPAALPAASAPLKSLADDFLHYSIVGNPQLARDNGQALLNKNADPREVLSAFETVAGERDVNAILLRNQRQDLLKDISAKIQAKLEEGYRAVARDPQRIRADIERLATNQRAYLNGRDHLLAAGPYAVPYYIMTLQDAKKTDLHPYVLRVMVEIGRSLLPPLIAQLQTPRAADKIVLIQVIGQIGYPQALPALKAVAADSASPPEVKKAANDAIAAIDAKGTMTKLSASDAFLALAEQYYHKNPSVALAATSETTAPLWDFDPANNNVFDIQVPNSIWFDLQAMRCSETALKLQANQPQAISLWLAANLRRELHLPASAKDPTRPANTPVATYYALAAGPIYINPVLQSALTDHDTRLALRAVQVLEATGGNQGLVSAKEGQTPLVKALAYPDRAVRFAAAFALARANPAQAYPDYFRVVPVLTEALSQTGTPSAILVDPDLNNRNRLKALLVAKNYNVFDGESLSVALENTRKVAAFELVIVPAGEQTARAIQAAQTDYRLASAPVLVTAPKDGLLAASASIAASNLANFKELDAAADAPALTAAIDSLKSGTDQTPIDAAAAAKYALTSINILGTLAGDHASIYSLNDALPTLAEALKDKRPEVVTGAAAVLAQLSNPDAQQALAPVALADIADNKIRVTLLSMLAESAKRAGNTLNDAAISRLVSIVSNAQLDPTVKNAAAAALGALNVASNQASTLILQQAK